MKYLLISLLGCLILGTQSAYGQQTARKIQKFNPVYGSQSDVNELLAFVSTNLKVELSEDQIKGINGYMTCKFQIDTLGNIHTIRVGHSLRPWIDYAIIGAMNRLPPYGIPVVDRRGQSWNVQRQLVFSFGSFFLPMDHMGFDGDKVAQHIQQEIDKQRAEIDKAKAERNLQWGNFTRDNSTLRYDTRESLKGNYPILPDGTDPLKSPIITPRISISQGELDRVKPVVKSAE
ncbi:MAG: hypothetical protein RR980_04435 [Mucinivorans sp.]